MIPAFGPVLALFQGPKGSFGSTWKRWHPVPIRVACVQSLSARPAKGRGDHPKQKGGNARSV